MKRLSIRSLALRAASKIKIWFAGGVRGALGSILQSLAGATYDYAGKAGRVYDNSVVAPGINWFWKNLLYPRIVVERTSAAGGAKIVEGHQFVKAVETGPYYDHTVLFHATILSWLINGNSYWIKVYSGSGKLLGFLWVPWRNICPVSTSATDLVTHYEYTSEGGEVERYKPSEIVHLRWGMDPENQMLGLSPIWAALREVCSENELATLSAALPRNAGLSAIVFSPKESVDGPTPAQRDEFREIWKRNTTGEAAGTPVFGTAPMDIHNIGFSPDQLIPEIARRINIERICVNMGLDPMVLGFKSENKTYSNYEQAVEAAYEGALLPMMNVWAIQLNRQVIAVDFPLERGIRVGWDTRQVRALQEDENEIADRVRSDWEAGLITRKTAKEIRGYAVDEARDDVYKEDLAPKPGLDEEGVKPKSKKEAGKRVAEAERLKPYLALLDSED